MGEKVDGEGQRWDSRKGEEREKTERRSREQGGDWVRKVEKTDTEARVGPRQGNLEN